MKQKEKDLFKSLCSFKSEKFDERLLSYATPTVLGQLFFNRMQAVAYGNLKDRGLLGKVNREFRNSLKCAYEQNVEKNESYFWCVQYIQNILSGSSCRYAMLKGAYLFKKYPHFEEGELTKKRSNYVCQNALIYYSQKLKLKDYLRISAEESKLTKNEVISITADIFESFLGAIFIDKGIDFAKEFVSKWIFKYIDQERVFFEDYKSAMKEYGDAKEVSIEYQILKEYGVPHDKTFIMACLIDGQEMGVGRGKNKKEAEQSAAKGAMRKLRLGRN